MSPGAYFRNFTVPQEGKAAQADKYQIKLSNMSYMQGDYYYVSLTRSTLLLGYG